MSTQPLSRRNAVVGSPTLLQFIYAVNAARRDVLAVDRVEIFDRDPVRDDFAVPPVQVIPGTDVAHPAQGVYEYLMAPVTRGGQFYYDVVYFQTEAGQPTQRDLGQVWVGGQTVQTVMPPEHIGRLRIYLHDNMPDVDYQFAPPSAPQNQLGVKSGTRFMWRDEQLDLALQLGMSRINQVFPVTAWAISFINQMLPHFWLQLSAMEALRMKSVLQIAEEFNYSVGSLSLEINRFDKYTQMIEAGEQAIMNETSGLPAAKKSLTVYSRTAVSIARNLFPSGVSNYSLSQGFPAGSATRTLFV